MKITHQLEAINSRRDVHGNCYWALRMVDHNNGQTVVGTVSGGRSNIYGIRQNWNADGWDEGVRFTETELPIREFNRYTKGWGHAGCTPDELAQFCRTGFKVFLVGPTAHSPEDTLWRVCLRENVADSAHDAYSEDQYNEVESFGDETEARQLAIKMGCLNPEVV